MPRVFIGIGSNINPEENIRKGIRMLAGRLRIVAVSTFYLNVAEDRPEQPPFYNGVVEADTDMHPAALKQGVLQPIEEKLGRVRTDDKSVPRTIDLDLLICGDLVGTVGDLELPDPQIARRAFFAVPLAELAPGMALPGSEIKMKDVAAAFAGHAMTPLHSYAEQLRRDLEDEP